MILIADSGSTKTDWKSTDGTGNTASVKTGGINPQYMDQEDIAREAREAASGMTPSSIKSIYFYGAGCSSKEKKDLVSAAIKDYFPEADIQVNGDLFGAARATCFFQPGIACILGTGSGSCVYDGEKIIKSIPSLGFILGDEGSGAYLGKQLVRDFLREEMPAEMISLIRDKLGITKEVILENVNRKPMPSKYLAGFSKFIHENINHTYVEDLVYHGFEDFMAHYITPYRESQEYPIHFVGSIARGFKSILNAVLESGNLELGKVEEAPINGLIEYHLSEHKYTL
ncbi:MAG: N-acetylglucosamine kinase [Cyclobacteriaceae bacterium]|nr:N-acetylglucosamine kinase [Cyclobacteriaceae bacterium]